MQRLAVITAWLLITGIPLGADAATTIYKKVDADGNVTFTDVPPRAEERAETIDLNAPNSFTPPVTPEDQAGSAPSGGETTEGRAVQAYTALEIVSPANDEAIRANAGNINVTASVEPPLASDHALQLLMDGAVVGEPSKSGNFSLVNVDRGTHELQAQVVDAQGAVLFTSSPSVFHLLRFSALQPGRRPPPRPGGAAVSR